MNDVYGFDEEGVQRIVAAVRRLEALYQDLDRKSGRRRKNVPWQYNHFELIDPLGDQSGQASWLEFDGANYVDRDPVEEKEIHVDYLKGYFFPGEHILAWHDGAADKWQASGPGHHSVRATLTETLTYNSTAAATVVGIAGDPEITVVDKALSAGQSIASGKTITADWIDAVNQWHLLVVRCEDVTG
ncbi:hypothetical protein Pan216_30440 [Planctomycetes bacterium Pan216]|uniref:Uncharacterized protein n=1 Tax=Kolteria novifilia TaxID=2527975 RepID=A0A518B5C0_9BACT|nr:hypothetical protein Pan216_30440 [Planctomycetes bacterium Pan216]